MSADPATRRQQRIVLGLAIVLAVISSMFIGGAVVVVWSTTCGGLP